jgi:hypothetical protein
MKFIEYKKVFATGQVTHFVSITKTNHLELFRDIIAVYQEKHMKQINKPYGQNVVINF